MWWQEYSPQAQIFHIGNINVNWYGVILVLAIVVAGYLARKKLAESGVINHRQFEDLFFYAVIFGLLGARVGHVLFEFDYYIAHPQDIIKIWNGGISLYGSLLGGALAVAWWCKKYKIKFLQISDRILPFFALAQGIGRWGNYFNQELFGQPTTGWWGIYISPERRPLMYYQQSYFQPAFFYESILNLLLFVGLLLVARKKHSEGKITFLYIIGYSLIRFFMEFIRIDDATMVGALRVPQVISLLFFLLGLGALFYWPIKTLSNSKK
jgi:phosphatidylglycerol:prolipoprotein diacylglycerol transferase